MIEAATPCVIELFGHNQIAGKITEQTIGGSAFLRVDVPAVEGQAAFTKFFGPGAIYAITPVDDATMLKAVEQLQAVPINRFTLQEMVHRALPRPARNDDDYYDQDDEDHDDE